MGYNCALKTVTATTDGLGQVKFNVFGHATDIGMGAGMVNPCATVTSLGQPLKTLRLSAFDLNASSGVNVADGSLVDAARAAWVNDPDCAAPGAPPPNCTYRARFDYNGDGLQNPADKSLWSAVRAAILGGAPTATCSAPAPPCP
jgi:hypothetical protein